MADPAEELAGDTPAISSASTVRVGDVVHVYRGELADRAGSVRILALAPSLADGPAADAFARAAGRWHNPSTHPNVVTVYERGREPRPWVAVEFVDGRPLEAVRDELTVADVRTVIVDAAEALDDAELYNTAHHDLGPDCVWVRRVDGETKGLVDEWGLERACRVAIGDPESTPFTAPELLDDAAAGGTAADVYGLGALTYYALTGTLPEGPSGDAGEESWVPPSDRCSQQQVGEDIDDVLARALSCDPDARQDSLYAFRAAIERALPDVDAPVAPAAEDPPDGKGAAGDEDDAGDAPTASERPSETSDESYSESGTDSDATGTAAGDDAETGTSGDESSDGGDGTDHTTDSDTAPDEEGGGDSTGVADSADDEGDVTDDESDGRARRAVLGLLGLGIVGGGGAYLLGSPSDGAGDPDIGDDGGGIDPTASPTEATDRALWHAETPGSVLSTPTVVDGTVYVGDRDGVVTAVDVSTGDRLWRTETPGEIQSSPTVVDDTAYVVAGATVLALAVDDGTEQWQFELEAETRASPAVVNDTVYVGSNGIRAFALDAGDGSIQWEYQTRGSIGAPPAVVDGTVYLGGFAGTAYALDAADGSLQWEVPTGASLSAPTVADGTVYLQNASGECYALAADDGSSQWQISATDDVRTSPVVGDDAMYLADGTELRQLAVADGSERWAVQTSSTVRSSPAVIGDVAYVTVGSTLSARSIADGSERWRYEAEQQLPAGPAVVDGVVYAAGDGVVAVEADQSTGTWPTARFGPRNTGSRL